MSICLCYHTKCFRVLLKGNLILMIKRNELRSKLILPGICLLIMICEYKGNRFMWMSFFVELFNVVWLLVMYVWKLIRKYHTRLTSLLKSLYNFSFPLYSVYIRIMPFLIQFSVKQAWSNIICIHYFTEFTMHELLLF